MRLERRFAILDGLLEAPPSRSSAGEMSSICAKRRDRVMGITVSLSRRIGPLPEVCWSFDQRNSRRYRLHTPAHEHSAFELPPPNSPRLFSRAGPLHQNLARAPPKPASRPTHKKKTPPRPHNSLYKSMRRLHLHFNLRDRLARVEVLRAGLAAVHDRLAAVDLEGVVEELEALGRLRVAAVGEPAVRLQEDGRPEVLVRVPPVRGARGRAARTQHAFVEPVELGAVGLALIVLDGHVDVRLRLKEGLDRLVLLVKVGHVRHCNKKEKREGERRGGECAHFYSLLAVVVVVCGFPGVVVVVRVVVVMLRDVQRAYPNP